MSNTKYLLVSTEQEQKINDMVEEWYNDIGHRTFSHSKIQAKHAVKEYIANQRGFTVYKHIADYPSDNIKI